MSLPIVEIQMSAFLQSGRSDSWKLPDFEVRFRPQTDIPCGVPYNRKSIITARIFCLYAGNYLTGNRNRIAAVVPLTNKVELWFGLDMTTKAVAAKLVDDIGETTVPNTAAIG